MKKGLFEINENVLIAENTMKILLEGDVSECRAGSFVNVKIDGCYLRRPLSVCDAKDGKLTLIYKIVGKGTDILSRTQKGELDILTGLGNGYELSVSGERPILVGGGAGVPPLYMAARLLAAEGKKVRVIIGFNKAEEVFFEKEFGEIGVEAVVTTADGSYGEKGFVTDAMKRIGDYTYFYACGPEPMLKAVARLSETEGQLSFEERMGCGFGACMGCTCKTLTGNKRICKEGPVLRKSELILTKEDER